MNLKVAANYKWMLAALILAIILLRLPALGSRTIHIDEGMGIRASELVLSGDWRYSPHNGHGPTLFYAGAVIRSFAGINPVPFRAFTAFCMLLAIFIFWIAYRRNLNTAGQIMLLAGLGLSSGLLFFSAYFIHESLFILLTALCLIALQKWIDSNQGLWLGFAVIFGALMYMTKETAILTFGAWTAAGALILITKKDTKPLKQIILVKNLIALAIGLAGSAILYLLFFGKNIDLLMAPYYWISERGVTMHIQPWHYFIDLLLRHEFLLLAAGTICFIALFYIKKWNPKIIFFALWFFFILALYSAIPYKTPWLIPNIILPLGLFVAFSISRIWEESKWATKKLLIFVFFVLLIICCAQFYLDNFYHPDRAQNYDYAYLQPGKSFQNFLAVIEGVAKTNSQDPLPIQIIGFCDELLYISTEKYNRSFAPFQSNLPIYINYWYPADGLKKLLLESNQKYIQLVFTYFQPGPNIDLFIREDVFDTYLNSPYFIKPDSVQRNGTMLYN